MYQVSEILYSPLFSVWFVLNNFPLSNCFFFLYIYVCISVPIPPTSLCIFAHYEMRGCHFSVLGDTFCACRLIYFRVCMKCHQICDMGLFRYGNVVTVFKKCLWSYEQECSFFFYLLAAPEGDRSAGPALQI